MAGDGLQATGTAGGRQKDARDANELRLALRLSEIVGESLLDSRRSGRVRLRPEPDGSTSTSAQETAASAVRRELARVRPGMPLAIARHAACASSERRLWAIEAVDDVHSYASAEPAWFSSIALVQRRAARIAVVSDVERGRTWSALAGGGAFSGAERLVVPARRHLRGALFVGGPATPPALSAVSLALGRATGIVTSTPLPGALAVAVGLAQAALATEGGAWWLSMLGRFIAAEAGAEIVPIPLSITGQAQRSWVVCAPGLGGAVADLLDALGADPAVSIRYDGAASAA